MDIDNRECISYVDSDGCSCELCIYEDGLCLFRECEDHFLELHLRGNPYAKIVNQEGNVKISAKVLAFENNNDILEMHYLIDDEERAIRIRYS